MGVLSLPGSEDTAVEKQRQIEVAMLLEDHESMKRLIGERVGEILSVGLTQPEMAVLEALRQEHGDLLRQLISEAFGRGWVRSGEPKLSNAMYEVLLAARHAIQGFQNPH